MQYHIGYPKERVLLFSPSTSASYQNDDFVGPNYYSVGGMFLSSMSDIISNAVVNQIILAVMLLMELMMMMMMAFCAV